MDAFKTALNAFRAALQTELDKTGLEVQRTVNQDTYAASKARRTHRVLATLLLAVDTATRRLGEG